MSSTSVKDNGINMDTTSGIPKHNVSYLPEQAFSPTRDATMIKVDDYLVTDLIKNLLLINTYQQNRSINSSNTNIIKSVEKNEREAGKVDNEKMLEMYIQKMNDDQNQLRQDIRSSEERTSSRVEDIEKKMDARLNRIEDMITQSSKNNDDSIKRLEDKIDQNNKHFQNMTNANIAFAVASVIAVVALVITAIVK